MDPQWIIAGAAVLIFASAAFGYWLGGAGRNEIIIDRSEMDGWQ